MSLNWTRTSPAGAGRTTYVSGAFKIVGEFSQFGPYKVFRIYYKGYEIDVAYTLRVAKEIASEFA